LRNQQILNTYDGYTGAFKHKFLARQGEKQAEKKARGGAMEKQQKYF